MAQRNSPPTVLLLDDDLGFTLALSQELRKRRVHAFPSRSVQEAQVMVAQLQLRLDVVVIHCGRPGACTFADSVIKDHPGARIVGTVSARHCCRQCNGRLAAVWRDPEDRAPERIAHCADIIQLLIRGHRSHAHRAGVLRP